MNIQLVKFRLFRLYKIVKDTPLPYLVIIFLMMAALGIFAWHLAKSSTGAYVLMTTGLLLTFLIHLKRKDFRFIFLIEERPSLVFASEYILFSLPLWCLLLFSSFPWLAGIYVIIVGGIARLHQPEKKMKYGMGLYRIIPLDCFEWRSGVRKAGSWLIAFYLLALLGLFFPYVSFLPLWLLTIFISDFYRSCEPLPLLNAPELPASAYLAVRIRKGAGLYLIGVFPVLLLYALIYNRQGWLVMAFLLLTLINIVLFIVTKYAVYKPGRVLVSVQLTTTLSALGILIPVFLPVTLFFIIRNYMRSLHTLKIYLYAYC